MIYIESLLLAILIMLFIDATVSDLNFGIIKNKSIAIALGIGFVCLIPYFVWFATDCLLPYFVNNVISILISTLLYVTGTWGAGDSKLLTVTTLLFPARLYCIKDNSLASAFLLITIVFILSFLYVVIDTLYWGIKEKNLFRISKLNFNFIRCVKSLLFFFFAFELINSVIFYFMPDNLLNDKVLLSSFIFIETIVFFYLEEKTNWIVILVMGIAYVVLFIVGFICLNINQTNWKIYIVVLILMLLRLIADKYNYRNIKVADLRPGMILSISSVLFFSKSRVSGLPSFSSEDLKSRLTKEEIDSITRWSKTQNGSDSVVIVRKIPFAIFISLGTILFTLMEVLVR